MEELRGLKEAHLRENCGICGEGICNNGGIQLLEISITTHFVDFPAMQRQSGLEMMLGGHVAIAQVLGANEDLTTATYKVNFLVCNECATNKSSCLHSILETVNDRQEKNGSETG